MVIWWFVGFRLFADLGLFSEITIPVRALFVFSGAFGLGFYLTLVATILHKYQESFSEKFLYKANTFLMVVLAVLILYFVSKLLNLCANMHIPMV